MQSFLQYVLLGLQKVRVHGKHAWFDDLQLA